MLLNYHSLYQEDLKYITSFGGVDWSKLTGRHLLLSGGTGQIGRCLIDAIMHKNVEENLGCQITVLTRDKVKAVDRFCAWKSRETLQFLEQDVNQTIGPDCIMADYVLHLASNTHSLAYANDPIGTIKTNIEGTSNLLDFAQKVKSSRFLLASTNEIYGENRGDTELMEETYCGYIDCNSLRAGYPEAKRCAEALCQAYRRQYGMDTVIARFTRTYGPTLLPSDSKALSQFIRNAVRGEDIVLKSKGDQMFSYTYVADAVTGLLCVLTGGKDGQAYNISEPDYDISLREMADLIAKECGKSVRFELPGEDEAVGFSRVMKARLSNNRIRSIGWSAGYSLQKGLPRTIQIIKDL